MADIHLNINQIEELVVGDQRRTMAEIVSSSGSFHSNPHQPQLVSSAASSPTMDGLLGIGFGPKNLEGIMRYLPTNSQIKTCLEQFEAHRAWMRRSFYFYFFISLLMCF